MSNLQRKSELIFKGKVFSLRRHTREEPGGLRVTREIIHHPGSAVILPILKDGKILMERQYRMAVGKTIWELPAGTVDPGESPLATAKRELAEETGFTSRRWSRLLVYYPSPGFVEEKMSIFVARDAVPGQAHMEPDERIATRAFELDELLRMIQQKKIVDSKTLIGLMFFSRYGG
jgi:ADP-ribose pyrophosphatase